MIFPEKPQGYVKQGLESIGHEVSYVYDVYFLIIQPI
jgi:hypothetical protein